MNKLSFASATSLLTVLAGIAACGDSDSGGGSPDARPRSDAPAQDASPTDAPATPAPSAVYILSNEADANRIVVFSRAADGTLTPESAYATGGKGAAAGLGSQGALVFDDDSERMFAVNAGDNSLSMLTLASDGALTMRSHVPAGGVRPVSITVHGDVVYVVNAGSPSVAANISGFRITANALVAIPGSVRPLSMAQPGPAQIEFSPAGTHLIVTEKMTNKIATYAVTDGVAAAPVVRASVGMTPFGFAFSDAGHLLVSEAFGGGPGLGATTSYAIGAGGALTPVSESVASGQSAPCWVVFAGGHAYVTNTASNTVTSYTVAASGALTLDDPNGSAATSGMGPIDADVSDDGHQLYVLDSGDDHLSIYDIAADGGLTRKPDVSGVSVNGVGLVAR
ncbi:MAG: beta-propeller fold lactonase family protein [Kofleriaceae bacterium]